MELIIKDMSKNENDFKFYSEQIIVSHEKNDQMTKVSPQIENDVLIKVTIIYIFVHEMSYTVVYYYREPYHTCSKLLFHFIISFFNQCS